MAPIGSAALRPAVTPPPQSAPAKVAPQAPSSAPKVAPQAPSTTGSAAAGAAPRAATPPAEWRGVSSFESGPQRMGLQLLQGGAQAAGRAATRPGAAAPTGQPIGNRENAAMDGQLMTTDNRGTTWGTGVAASQVPGANGRETVMWVNGIRTSAADHQDTLRMLEQQGGTRAVGLYNATEGMLRDTLQVSADRNENTQRAAGTFQGPSRNAATNSLADSLVNHLNTSQEPLHLMAHSQGGVVTANALYQARQRLEQQHGAARADEMMGRLNVETFGGAARNYVDGPRYTHWINDSDNVTGNMGPDAQTGGRGATINRFNVDANRDPLNHSFTDVYWPHRQQQMQQQQPN